MLALCASSLANTPMAPPGVAFTYPVKSTNLDQAWTIDWYNGFSTESLSDIVEGHAVGGCTTSDGGYVVVGSGGANPDENNLIYAFALKVDRNGAHEWSWFGRPAGTRDRTMIANAAAELVPQLGL
eukprot:4717174-Prymnesium_polylepis.1